VSSIFPGATVGILGGGQLGRMVTLAARTLGYHVHVLDPDPHCAAGPVADKVVTAKFDDAEATARLAAECDVVTIEIERIAVPALEAAARQAPLRPGAHVLSTVQDRARQKEWLVANGFPVGPFRTAATREVFADAARRVMADAAGRPTSAYAKSCTGGYDGRGQVRLERAADADAAWVALGGGPCVIEQALDLEAEISVLVARRPNGTMVVYPPALNHHVRGVLDWSVIPAPISPIVAQRASEVGLRIAERLNVVGLLVVELFLLRDGSLTVNELAPRPHNTFHHTELTVLTSQFEQLVRAVCDLPLGATDVVRPAAIANLFGDLWLGDTPPAWEEALSIPGVRIHLYGKAPRPGRKVGHIGAVGLTTDEAVARVKEARSRLERSRTPTAQPPAVSG